ncbi:MAG: restriction endonuclease subunit S [Acidobacteriota bacterium]|nr:restriction endonuclease subunit S [Acidobacteriota bacterium]
MTPAVRFKGFTDPWEQRKLGDIAVSFEYGLNAAACEYDGVNKYLRITDIDDDTHEFRVEDLTSPQADLAASAGYLLSEGDLLFARTGASVGKTYLYRPFDGKVFFAGFLIRAKIGNDADPEFVFQSTLTDRYRKYVTITSQRSGQPGVNAQEYSDFELPLPSQPEQKQIGSLLHGLDNLITLHQRKYDQLAVLKKALLDKMFPRDGAFVPEIRFVGFTDPWEQRKLGDITDRYKELVPTPRDGYTRMGVRSHAKGTFLAEVEPGQQIEERELSKVRANNLVVNIVFAWEHAVAITSEDDAKALVSHRFPQFSFHDDMEPGFFRYATLDEDFRRHLWLASPSGAGRNKTLNIGTMLEYEFTLPSRKEQAEISKLFDRLDNLITLHQRKLGLLKNLKVALLDKMFV